MFRTSRANLASVGHLGRLATFSAADMSSGFDTADSPVTIFTVTGDVLVQIFGVVQATALTSASNTGTLAIGTAEVTGGVIAASTVNGTQFAITDVWVDTTPANDIEAMSNNWYAIGGGANVIVTIATNNMTAGALEIYCLWRPLSSDALVVSA